MSMSMYIGTQALKNAGIMTNSSIPAFKVNGRELYVRESQAGHSIKPADSGEQKK